MSIRSVFILAALAIATGCGTRDGRSESRSAATPGVSASVASGASEALDQRLGWLDDSCLAIANKALAIDTPIVVVSLYEKPATLVEGRVVGATDSPDICSPLRDERRSANVNTGLLFYEVALAKPVKSGIGVVGAARRVGEGLDVDGDGRPETFTQCMTSEGVSYQVWRGVAYQGKALWSGYYYLGYDTESNCPPLQ